MGNPLGFPEGINPEYYGLCPNCGGKISAERLIDGLPCEACLPPEALKKIRKLALEQIAKELPSGELKEWLEKQSKLRDICRLFERIVGAKMWGAQLFWARRFVDGESFAMIAPTGSGKTTMQIVLAIYAALSNPKKRSLILVPTTALADQVHRKLLAAVSKLKLNPELTVAAYHSHLTPKQKEENKRLLDKADIVVTTSLSVLRLDIGNVDIAFVDDVDSFLRRSKSMDKVLSSLFGEKLGEVLENAERLLEIDRELRKSRRPELVEERERRKAALEKLTEGKIIIVSGATQTARRTKRVRLLSKITGFVVGGTMAGLVRNIRDVFVPLGTFKTDAEKLNTLKKKAAEWVRRLGKGGLVFVPMDLGSSFAEDLVQYLKKNVKELRVELYKSGKKRVFRGFEQGEIDVLVGTASYRSPLVRGIDLPQRVRYALFVGVPKYVIRIKPEDFHPMRFVLLLSNIADVLDEPERNVCERWIGELLHYRLFPHELQRIREAIVEGKRIEDNAYLDRIRERAQACIAYVERLLKRKEIVEKLKEHPRLCFKEAEREISFLMVDPVTYVQASGRTSRLYAGGITKGLSVVLVDIEKAFNALTSEVRELVEEISWEKIGSPRNKIISEVLKEIDEDREKVRRVLEGKLKPGELALLKTCLLVVESPNKARTIARMFGRPTRKEIAGIQCFEVAAENRLLIITATGGHFLDVTTEEVPGTIYGIRVGRKDHSLTISPIYVVKKVCRNCGNVVYASRCPKCGSEDLKEAPVVEALRQIAKRVDEILVATDPDAEGEKIAWDVYQILRPFNPNIRRARFHEVTRKALFNAIQNPEDFDVNLVASQIVRRVEDRWIGFALSQAVQEFFKKRTYSAGRVQTPVLGWIVERTRALKDRIGFLSLRLRNGLVLNLRIPLEDYSSLKKGKAKPEDFEIEVIDKSVQEQEVKPPPPFTTDALLAEAARVLKLSPMTVMAIAQELFEMGLITYHRTDSTTVSYVGRSVARDYISDRFGEAYFVPREWKMPGAHECIRPTRPIDARRLRNLVSAKILRFPRKLTPEHYRVYDLIFRRFMASQMAPAKLERLTLRLRLKCKGRVVKVLTREGEVADYVERSYVCKIAEEGFLKVLKERVRRIENLEEFLEGFKVERILKRRKIPKVGPLTFESVVNTMKEREIGRPSTYSKIIDVLLERGYVVQRKTYLLARNEGERVYEFLQKKYGDLVSEEVTRELLRQMDEIAQGKRSAIGVIEDLLKELYEKIPEMKERFPEILNKLS